MTHARTLPRYVGAAGLIAGLLVAVPSLAFEKVHISNVTVGGSTPTTINAYVNARYQYSPLDSRRYYRWQVPVAKSTLRTGALSALGRGVMHPGFQVAVLAAGLVISGTDILKSEPESILDDPELAPFYDDYVNDGSSYFIEHHAYRERRFGTPVEAALWHGQTFYGDKFGSISYHSGNCRSSSGCTFSMKRYDQPSGTTTLIKPTGYSSNNIDMTPDFVTGGEPATQFDLDSLDPHIPPQLLEELWADLKPDVTTRPFTITPQTYPEPWYNQLDVSTLPLSQLSTTGTPAPEVVTHVAKQMENLDAQMEGREKPHPSVTVAPGASADEEMLDRWDEPVPDFTEVTPEWQVETIDELPSYNIGIGSGQCPPPTVITLPFPLNSNLVINWQPFCDLAAMIRGAVIAVAMILSLYIVLRRG